MATDTADEAAAADRRLEVPEGNVPLPYFTLQAQRQDSLDAQLRDVVHLANRAGCYDAADWITARLTARSSDVD